MHPFWWLLGYSEIGIARQSAAALIELCRRGGYVYRDARFSEEDFSIRVSALTARRILADGERLGLAVSAVMRGGLPSLALRYRRRVGILIGMVLCAAIVFCSGRVLWGIRIEGNERLTEQEIVDQLSRCGFEIGMPLDGIRDEVIENRMLILSDEISWISVNMNGTVAHVEIRETLPEERPQGEYAASNLVASRSGQIVRLEDIRGELAVSLGDVVAAGELLVGGLYGSEVGGLRYTRARGRVLAQTERSFEVEIPLSYEEKVYSDESRVEKYLIFFKKEGKIFANAKKIQGECDIINTVEYFKLPGGVTLPFGVRTVRYLPYETCVRQRDAEQTVSLALVELRSRIRSEAPDAELLYRETMGAWRENAYVLSCRASFIENIAVEREIEIKGLS